MTLTFFSNRLNHHQAPVADELHVLLGDSFHFVETTEPAGKSSKGSTEDFSGRPYLVCAWRDDASQQYAEELSVTSDVAVFGASSSNFEVARARTTDKLTFDLSERWFKRGVLNLLSPRLLKHIWYYHTVFRNKPVFKLCASAFATKDEHRLLAFRDRCFKWGYFPRLAPRAFDEEPLLDSFRFMWCSRFLKLKHPELAIKLVSRLHNKGYSISLDMYGDGGELARSKELVSKLGLNDIVRFFGATPNEAVLDEMRKHDVFLFTSDRKEGWGVVANEAMANGCVLVASDAIGSTPYLVKHRETGLVFKSGCLQSLENEVQWLLDNRQDYRTIRKNGQESIARYWNPEYAAKSLVKLCQNMMGESGVSDLKEGPCSKA